MSFLDFLNTLENTLEEIEVKGKKNIDYMYGCFIAIDEFRKTLKAQAIKEQKGKAEQDKEE